MSGNACRLSDAVALFFGIDLSEDEAARLDQGVRRLHGRLEAGLFRDEAPAGFEPPAGEAAVHE